MRTLRLFLLVGLVISANACKGEDKVPTAIPSGAVPGAAAPSGAPTATTTVHGACNRISKDSNCEDMVGATYATLDRSESCNRLGGGAAWSKDPCPSDARVGSCRMFAGKPDEWIVHYYAQGPDSYTADKAKRECEMSRGIFAPFVRDE